MKEEAPKIDTDEFHQRWLKARVAALHKANAGSLSESSASVIDNFDEAELVDKYFSDNQIATSEEKTKKKDTLLRNIFDNSRLLARSLSKHLGLTFEVHDFKTLLETSKIPCVQGDWESRLTAQVLTRTDCGFCSKSGSNACDYWREALDGLVMGLGDKERLARHASVRHGDSLCVDVFFIDNQGRKETPFAWGPIPEHMSEKIETICKEFEAQMKVSILIKGMSESILYFTYSSSTDMHCSGGQLLTFTFQRKIKQFYPGLSVQEVTPRAVLGVEK